VGSRGIVDAITVLKEDHKLFRRLFAELGRTTDRARDKARQATP
jgi:hypothetical protein